MVISLNPDSHRIETFQQLLDDTILKLVDDSSHNQSKYLSSSSTDIENIVTAALTECAIDTPFEGTIKLIGSQSFPDIVAAYDNYFGVEVKTSKSKNWKSTGSSVLESTRIKNVEKIFMLFGKLCAPVDFKCRPYEECLSEVRVTHSPRYLIDMNLPDGETFFDKLGMTYDTLRKEPDPICKVLDYYEKTLKPGETTWWSRSGDSKSSNIIVRLWRNLSKEERNTLISKGFCLFPEMWGKRNDKYSRFTLWLATVEGVLSPSMRDNFSAGGQIQIEFNGRNYYAPRIVKTAEDLLPLIHKHLLEYDIEELNEHWDSDINPNDVYNYWCQISAENIISFSDFPLYEYLRYKGGYLG